MDYRFICNRWPQYKLWHEKTPYQFTDGVLDTDDEGARFIRSLAHLYPRFIMDGDPTAPAHGKVPEDFTPSQVTVPETFYCADCDKFFKRRDTLWEHTRKYHGGA